MGKITQVIGRHPILLTLLVVLAVAVLPEVILMALKYPPAEYERGDLPPHPTYLWVLEPGQYKHGQFTAAINHHGMRGRTSVPVETLVGSILLVGDSSIFGWEVPDNATLGRSLERAMNNRIEVFNGGVPGYSTEQSLRWLDYLLPITHPQLVVIANQWSDSTVSAFVDLELLEETSTFGYRARYHLLRLASYSRLWRAVRYVTRESRGLHPLQRTIDDMRSDLAPGEGEPRVPVEDYTRNLRKMVEKSREAGSDVVLLVLAGAADLTVGDAGMDAGDPVLEYRRAMAEIARESGCPLLRADAALRATGLPASTLFVDGIHPSATGQAVLAKALAKLLDEKGWERGQILCKPPVQN
jgi:lysophospholipase L1-like esterase